MKRWFEHVSNLLNQPSCNEDMQSSWLIPGHHQKEMLKSYHATKHQVLTTYLQKLINPIETATQMLDELLCRIWQDENVPKECKERPSDKISKKGNLSPFDNCREIMLLSLQGKILKRGISQWLKAAVDTTDNQGRFRQNKWRSDQTATLRVVL